MNARLLHLIKGITREIKYGIKIAARISNYSAMLTFLGFEYGFMLTCFIKLESRKTKTELFVTLLNTSTLTDLLH